MYSLSANKEVTAEDLLEINALVAQVAHRRAEHLNIACGAWRENRGPLLSSGFFRIPKHALWVPPCSTLRISRASILRYMFIR